VGWAAAAAIAWCAAFAAVHVFWALGGSAGLASSAGTELATRRPAVFVLAGLWGVAALLACGAAVVYVVVAAPGLSRRWRRAGAWLLVAVGAGLVLRAVAVEALLAADAGVRSAVGPLETRWSLLLWNPVFAAGGVLFVVTGNRVLAARRKSQGADSHVPLPKGPRHSQRQGQ
jgi:hypothetical protein